MKAPLISIVCTNYNKGDWIADAIESFLRQKGDISYEIILIDDKSTDHSASIIKKYAQKYPDIIRAFYNKKNLGITKTWIKACKEARGTYIARCDGDDYWTDEHKLQKQIALLRENRKSQWCSTDYDIVTPSGEVTDTSAFEAGLVDRSRSYAEMLATKGFTMSSTWLVDAELMRVVNEEIDNDAVDDTFNIQLELFQRTKLTYLPEATVVYRINEGSDSRPIDIGAIRSRHERLLHTQLEYIDKYRDSEYEEIIKILLRRNFEIEMLATERLKHINNLNEHIKSLDKRIIELEQVLHDIRKSRTYRWVVKSMAFVRVSIAFPKRVVRRLLWLDGHRRYARFYEENVRPTASQLSQEAKEAKKFTYTPLISIVVPTYNTDPVFFCEMLESVKCQIYPNWELILIDDASPDKTVRTLSQEAAAEDSRIIHKALKKNRHIAGATNEGFAIAKGEYVSLLDHDDTLHPSVLFEIVKSLNENREIDVVYTDEDKIVDGKHRDPYLKPDWNPGLLWSTNYITHFTTIRRSIIEKIGGERGEYNGAQDWDVILRATYEAGVNRIHHIPKILYSWRVHSDSTASNLSAKPYVFEAQKKLLYDNLIARGYREDEFTIDSSPYIDGTWIVEFPGNAAPQHTPGDMIDFSRIKGVAMNEREIYKNIGRGSMTVYFYQYCRYDMESEHK